MLDFSTSYAARRINVAACSRLNQSEFARGSVRLLLAKDRILRNFPLTRSQSRREREARSRCYFAALAPFAFSTSPFSPFSPLFFWFLIVLRNPGELRDIKSALRRQTLPRVERALLRAVRPFRHSFFSSSSSFSFSTASYSFLFFNVPC